MIRSAWICMMLLIITVSVLDTATTPSPSQQSQDILWSNIQKASSPGPRDTSSVAAHAVDVSFKLWQKTNVAVFGFAISVSQMLRTRHLTMFYQSAERCVGTVSSMSAWLADAPSKCNDGFGESNKAIDIFLLLTF